MIVSTKRNNGSPNTVDTGGEVCRGGVALTITLVMKGSVRRGRPRIGILCAQGASMFMKLGSHTHVTGGTGTSLFVSVRAGTTGGESTGNTRACALNMRRRQARQDLRVTGHRGNMVLLRSGPRGRCTGFGPGSPRDCVVFRCVRDRCIGRDVRVTRCMRRGLASSTGHRSHKMERTNFLILDTASVPDVLIRLKCVDRTRRTGCLTSDGKRGGVDQYVDRTFSGCCTSLGGVDSSTLLMRTASSMSRRRRPRDARPVIARRSAPMFGVRFLASSGGLSTGSETFGNLAPVRCCCSGKMCGCACNTSAGCGRVLHVGEGIGRGFGSTFVMTFVGKRHVSAGRTVTLFGGGGPWRPRPL